MTYIVCNDVYDLFNLQSNLNGILNYAQNLLLHKVHCYYDYNIAYIHELGEATFYYSLVSAWRVYAWFLYWLSLALIPVVPMFFFVCLFVCLFAFSGMYIYGL